MSEAPAAATDSGVGFGNQTGLATIFPGVEGDHRAWEADERQVARFDHFDRQALQLPASAELERLGVDVGKPVGAQSLLRPLDGPPMGRRVRQARADHSW